MFAYESFKLQNGVVLKWYLLGNIVWANSNDYLFNLEFPNWTCPSLKIDVSITAYWVRQEKGYCIKAVSSFRLLCKIENIIPMKVVLCNSTLFSCSMYAGVNER